MVPVQYKTRDSVTINGYLTLPNGYTLETAKDLPVVVNPHGGPWARDGWYFNPEVQFLANRGYAVCSPISADRQVTERSSGKAQLQAVGTHHAG